MAYWKDNADSYICSNCGFECNNPNKLPYGPSRCPKCNAVMGDISERRWVMGKWIGAAMK